MFILIYDKKSHFCSRSAALFLDFPDCPLYHKKKHFAANFVVPKKLNAARRQRAFDFLHQTLREVTP
jgi:hypothetical protein